MLLHNGYTFVKDRQFIDSINWRCSLFKRLKCRARAVTKLIDGQEKIKFTFPYHTHNCSPKNTLLKLKKDN